MDAVNVPAIFEVHSFTRSEIIAIEVLGGGCEPPIFREEEAVGVGDLPLERALVSSYRPSIITFPPSLRV